MALAPFAVLQAQAQTSPAARGQGVAEVGKVVQVVGQARLDGKAVQAGASVLEGQQLSTGGDGYLYVQTADKGFFILRPNSSARVPAYRIDAAQPANSRFKFELEHGVARSISGQAVPAARQNYRFNTPVAAIGVLGTDFTVFTDQATTRVAVSSGGVVVSGFGEGCLAEGSGPCDNASRQQLLASQVGQVLQVSRGSVAPQMLRGGALAPDAVIPPRADEPSKTSAGAPLDNNSLAPIKMSTLDEAQHAVVATAPPAVLWGRWQPIADQPANMELTEAMKNGKLAGLNGNFAVLRAQNAPWVMPQEAAASFQLRGYQAQIETGGSARAAQLDNGQLNVNFVQRNFSTSFDLVNGAERIARRAEGALGADGTFANANQFLGNNSMLVQGVLGQPAGVPGLQAGYVFQSRLDDNRTASGVTYWTAR